MEHVSDFQFTSIYIKVIWELMWSKTQEIKEKHDPLYKGVMFQCVKTFLGMCYYVISYILIEHVSLFLCVSNCRLF